jgi:hypothetical protein
MVSAQQGPHGDFRRVTRKVGEVGQGEKAIEVFDTSIENPRSMLQFAPKNLVDFRTCPHVPRAMREQASPEDRWILGSAVLGIEVAYSKEFINWKLWGISEETSCALRAGFAEDDPGYLFDYGALGLAAKNEATSKGVNAEERFAFCRDYILERIESTPHSDLGLFGAWLSGAKIQPCFVRQTAYEAQTT